MFLSPRPLQLSALLFSLLATACGGRVGVERDVEESEGGIDANSPALDASIGPLPMDSDVHASDSQSGTTDSGMADTAMSDTGAAKAEASAEDDATLIDGDVGGSDASDGDAAVDASAGQDATLVDASDGDAAVDTSAAQDATLVDASGGDASVDASAAQDATPVDAAEAGPPATLAFVLANTDWTTADPLKGIAAGAQEQVYVSDGDSVHVVTGTTVDTYMTREDVSAVTGIPPYLIGLDDIGTSLPGDLFILAGSMSAPQIIFSTTAHEGVVFRTITGQGWPRRLSVGSPDLIGVLTQSHGLSVVTPEGSTLLFANDATLFSYSCGSEDLAVLPSGLFLYSPGCTGFYDFIRGTMDGAGFEVIHLVDPVTHAALRPMCIARAPAGGFYAMMWDGVSDRSLQYFDPNFTATSEPHLVPTDPPIDSVDWHGSRDCAMAVAPTGTIFFLVVGDLWRIDP